MQYISSSLTDVGRVRSANEDNYGEAQTPNGHVFVVCDGMGGHVGGATASKIAVSSILEYFSKETHENLIQALDRALVFANEQVYAQAVSDPGLKGMGTTALVLIIKGDECYIGHVGDSRIYLKSEDKLNRLTKDHSFVQTLVDSGVISDEDAESHPNKNQILKALGISPNLEPTICQSPILPKKGDVFMLCSDGMNGMVNDRSMEMMIDFEDLNRSSQILIQAALDAGGHDNVTVTLVGITESPHATSQFKNFNPKPKFDASGTQTFNNVTQTGQSKQNKKWLFASIGLIVLALCFVVYIKFFNSPDNLEEEGNHVITINDLKKWRYADRDILWSKEVEDCPDTSLIICDDKLKVVVDGAKIVSMSQIIKNEDGTTKYVPIKPKKSNRSKSGKNESKNETNSEVTNPNPGSEDINENPPSSNESSTPTNEGSQSPPGGTDGENGNANDNQNPDLNSEPESSKNVEGCDYEHKIKRGETLSKIAEKLNYKKCSNMTEKKLYTQNKDRLNYSSPEKIKPDDILMGSCDCHK